MSRHLDNLSRVFRKMSERYGSDDPIVLQLKNELTSCQDRESMHLETFLPHGERRSRNPSVHYWEIKRRQGSGSASAH